MNRRRQRKEEQLGMSEGAANHRLIKKLIFYLACKLDMGNCYKCGKPMSEKDFSIEHKKEWMYSDNPPQLYFDTSNIAFSHRKCNKATRGQGHRSKNMKFKGIFLEKIGNRVKPWRAQVSYKSKRYDAGSYATAEEAARAYDKKALELFGDKFITNEKLHLFK